MCMCSLLTVCKLSENILCFSVCPNCAHPKVCVVDGSSASCKCPEDYHEDNFGGCVHAIGIYLLASSSSLGKFLLLFCCLLCFLIIIFLKLSQYTI